MNYTTSAVLRVQEGGAPVVRGYSDVRPEYFGLQGVKSGLRQGGRVLVVFNSSQRQRGHVVAAESVPPVDLAAEEVVVWCGGSYIHVTASGIQISGDVTIDGDLQVTGDVNADGDVIADGTGGVSLMEHTHMVGSATTGPPIQ